MKKNIHIARRMTLRKINKYISRYSVIFPTPKYLLFMKEMLEKGWEVKLHEVKVSKYVFVTKDNKTFKIRFSNHKPIYEREMNEDCDYYVGISHLNVRTTEEIINWLNFNN